MINKKKEIMQRFKKIVGYSLYEISNDGTIRKIVTKEIISQRIHPGYGYKMCDLQDNNLKVHTVYPHKEVARAYISTRKKGKLYVIHINGKQQDNRVQNLQWATPAEAQIHQLKMGFRKRLGNPELYKFSKFWQAKHLKKFKGKAATIIPKKSTSVVKAKMQKKSKALASKPLISKNKVVGTKKSQPKKVIKSKKPISKLLAKGKKARTAKKAVAPKKTSGKSKKTSKSKVQIAKKSLPIKKTNSLAKKPVINKKKTVVSKKSASRTSELKKHQGTKKITGIKKPVNIAEARTGKRKRIKYKKIISTKLK
jgi:hypothetical protein